MSICRASRTLIAFAIAATASAQSGWIPRPTTLHPAARGFHAMAYDLNRGTTVMFGGRNSVGPFGDTWEWSGANWTHRLTANSPPARSSHALALDQSRGIVVLFGGTSGTGADLGDTWEYDGQDWLQRQPVNSPGPRREARMAADVARSLVVLFGGGIGASGLPVLGDTWAWNGSTWTLRNPATSPPARWSHGMTYDYGRGRIVLFGGANAAGTALQDTWAWTGAAWSQLQTVSSPSPRTRTAIAFDSWRSLVCLFSGHPNGADTWLFDGFTWRRDPRTIAPPLRASSSLVHDVLRGRTVLFGGFHAGVYSNDTWEYEPGTIARWVPFGAGCAGSAGVSMLRPAGTSQPSIGTVFRIELLSLPNTGVAAITIGFSDQQWNGHALPWSLGAFGMPGCTLHSSPDVPSFVPIAAGHATLAWPLPNDPGLVDMRFFHQGLVIDPGVNPMGVIVSNAGAGIVGPF